MEDREVSEEVGVVGSIVAVVHPSEGTKVGATPESLTAIRH